MTHLFVCGHMILGTDFTAMNFVGVIWTREGMRKLMHSNRKTITELPDSTSGVHLVLGYSVKIRPGGHLTIPLECTRPITDRMDIRMDMGFHHRNPNVHVALCGTPSALGVSCLWCSCLSMAILGNFGVGTL